MLNIMVVDDSAIILKTLSRNLHDMGFYVCATAKNGADAIKLYQEHQPDIVTMDITMPEIDGIEALTEIKKIDANAKVIMVTSHGEERLVMDAISLGAKGYILKPITPLKIKQALQKACPHHKESIEQNYIDMSLTY